MYCFILWNFITRSALWINSLHQFHGTCQLSNLSYSLENYKHSSSLISNTSLQLIKVPRKYMQNCIPQTTSIQRVWMHKICSMNKQTNFSNSETGIALRELAQILTKQDVWGFTIYSDFILVQVQRRWRHHFVCYLSNNLNNLSDLDMALPYYSWYNWHSLS